MDLDNASRVKLNLFQQSMTGLNALTRAHKAFDSIPHQRLLSKT